MTAPLTTGLVCVLLIWRSNSGSLAMLIAFADPEQRVVPIVRHVNCDMEAAFGESAYEQIALNITSTVNLGLVS